MQNQKSKKILIYFFLFILVCSINNINLNTLKIQNISNIKVLGLNNDNNLKILKKINELNLGNIFFINKDEFKDLINLNNMVENYQIFKKYSSSLIVTIEKTKFLARININKKTFLLGSNGKLSDNNFENIQLPYIFGKPEIKEFLNFKQIIDGSNFLYNDVKNLYFFPSKRWDIELKNNIIIKLSKDYTKISLDLAFEFLNNHNFEDIKVIDIRIKDQIILNG